jgi:hypothetical protein
MENVPYIARILSNPEWRADLHKLKAHLYNKYPDYSNCKNGTPVLTPSPERIFLGDMKLSDVFKLLDAVEEGLKK